MNEKVDCHYSAFINCAFLSEIILELLTLQSPLFISGWKGICGPATERTAPALERPEGTSDCCELSHHYIHRFLCWILGKLFLITLFCAFLEVDITNNNCGFLNRPADRSTEVCITECLC